MSLQSDLTAELEKSKAGLKTAVYESNRALEQEIYEHRRKMSMSLFRTWLIAIVVLAVIALGLTLWSMIQGLNIAEQRQTLAILEEEGGKMKFSRCGEERRLCVMIDEKAPQYQNGYRVIKGY
jgi:cytoskeletal protein RodZ